MMYYRSGIEKKRIENLKYKRFTIFTTYIIATV